MRSRIQNPALPPGFTPEQMQAMIAFFMQNQANAGYVLPHLYSNTILTSYSQWQPVGLVRSGPKRNFIVHCDCPPTPVKTPPRRKATKAPPATPRAPGNQSNKPGAAISSATSTPSSKMAQLTLEGRKLPSTPARNGKRRPSASSAIRKGPVPTGEDPMSDPYEGFPEIVTLPPKTKGDKPDEEKDSDVTPKATRSRRKRSEYASDSSPPAVQSSPKKKARIVSPTVSPAPSPTSTAKNVNANGILSPFESPGEETAADVRALKRLLESVRSGAKIPGLGPLLERARDADLLDTEAECSDGDGDEDAEGNLDGFIVGDDVVEYDVDAPALPDDDDDEVQPLHRRRSRQVVDDEEEERTSDVEIVPMPNKGKGRAPPPPPSPPPVPKASGSGVGRAKDSESAVSGCISWQDAHVDPVNCDQGLHPGSTAVDVSASALPKLYVYLASLTSTLRSLTHFRTVGGNGEPALDLTDGCALVLSDYKDDGWGNPPVDIVAMAETNIHLPNFLRGLLFRVQGPYVNGAQVNTDDIVAVLVSPPNSTQRYKVIKTDTRAPAIFITGGIARYWRLDTPTTGSHPIKYISMTQFESNFDRSVAVDCTVFGQKELNCISFNNAIRYSTLPVFDRPAAHITVATPNTKVKPSSSIRRNGASQTSRRAPNFEMSTADVVPVYDARKTALPVDISKWQQTLPLFEGPLPKNAVVFVAHTTNMWVGTRSTTSASAITHNVQYNLVFIVIVGVLPLGYV
ncbi:hypothetical protein K525DRAFT_211933 [Schizophyllum commune Loenen D]|nr:hypothetical protein K525DRAFT_211933 [Schizophyllum commune Loenen D]